MAFAVETPVYEGPLDLLLQLILKEQVDLYEVDLATIVDAYLAEVERLQALDLEVATEFLLIAATLVELKTRRLLPGHDDGDLDEELALWSERDLLLARLLECKTFKDVARVLNALSEQADLCFPRRTGADERFAGLMPDLLEEHQFAASRAPQFGLSRPNLSPSSIFSMSLRYESQWLRPSMSFLPSCQLLGASISNVSPEIWLSV